MISVVNPWNDARWEAIAQSAPSSTFFHRKEWARVLHDTYAFTSEYLLRNGKDADGYGALPLMEIDSWMTGKRVPARSSVWLASRSDP